MAPQSERNRRRDQTARLPGHWRRLGPKGEPRPVQDYDPSESERDGD